MKVQLNEEELAAIIKQTQSQLEDLEVGGDEDNDENDEETTMEADNCAPEVKLQRK